MVAGLVLVPTRRHISHSLGMEAFMPVSFSRTLRWVCCAAFGCTFLGCVSQDQYNALKLEKDRMAEQLVSAQRDASTKESEAAAYKAQIDQITAAGGNDKALIANAMQQNATLQAQLDDLNKRYQDSLNRPVGTAALPEPLTNELTNFANQYPDLVDF